MTSSDVIGEALPDDRRRRLARLLHRVADRIEPLYREQLHLVAATCAEPPDTFTLGDVMADVAQRRDAATRLDAIDRALAAQADIEEAIARGWWETVVVLALDHLDMGVVP